jgi:hypothetical protein
MGNKVRIQIRETMADGTTIDRFAIGDDLKKVMVAWMDLFVEAEGLVGVYFMPFVVESKGKKYLEQMGVDLELPEGGGEKHV